MVIDNKKVEKLKELRKCAVVYQDEYNWFYVENLTDQQLLDAYSIGYLPIPF